MLRFGKFPYGLGNHIKFQVHQPLEITGNPDDLINTAEERIKQGIRVTE